MSAAQSCRAATPGRRFWVRASLCPRALSGVRGAEP